MTANSKARCANFTKEQNDLLLDIVRNFPCIENISKSKVAIDNKEQAWKVIHEQFSAVNLGPPRTVEQLETRYKRMALEARKKNDALKRHMRGTGGGPPAPPLKDDEQILVALQKDRYDPLDNDLDDDCYVNEYPASYVADVEEAVSNFETSSSEGSTSTPAIPSTSTAVPKTSTTMAMPITPVNEKCRSASGSTSSNTPMTEWSSSKTASTEDEVVPLSSAKRKTKRRRLSPLEPIPLSEGATIVALAREEKEMKHLLWEDKRAVVAQKLALLEEEKQQQDLQRAILQLEKETKEMEKMEDAMNSVCYNTHHIQETGVSLQMATFQPLDFHLAMHKGQRCQLQGYPCLMCRICVVAGMVHGYL